MTPGEYQCLGQSRFNLEYKRVCSQLSFTPKPNGMSGTVQVQLHKERTLKNLIPASVTLFGPILLKVLVGVLAVFCQLDSRQSFWKMELQLGECSQ